MMFRDPKFYKTEAQVSYLDIYNDSLQTLKSCVAEGQQWLTNIARINKHGLNATHIADIVWAFILFVFFF